MFGNGIGRKRIVLLAWMVTALTAGCSGLLVPPRPAPVAVFDLGVNAAPVETKLPVPLSGIDLTVPTWLRGTAIQYSFEWNQPLRRRAYAESRWAAPPAEMFTLALQRGLNVGLAGQGCRLVVELDEFIQVFQRADSSQVEISGRATLVSGRNSASLTTWEFRLAEPALMPDAEGGVMASRALAGRLSGQLAEWLSVFDQEQTRAGKTGAYCR